MRKRWTEWPGSAWDRRLLLAAGVLFLAQACLYLTWFVDDAAISMTYARNLARGYGLVLYPGGESVEAYSNPLWVFVLAAGALIGVNLFVWAKGLGILFGLAAVYYVARVGARLQGLAGGGVGALERSRGGVASSGSAVPVGGIAALLTAAHTPFVAWTTSGLEGGLYLFLLLWATEAVLDEVSRPTAGLVPWSGLAFFLVSITRPEGILFFVAAGAVKAAWDCRARIEAGEPVPWRVWAMWGTLFGAPWLAYQVWHLVEFGTLVTNTYYAKRPETAIVDRFLNGDGRGWRNVRNWVAQYRLGWTLPVMALGLGARGSRLLDRNGWLLIVSMLAAALFFPLYADGDWMREFRFLVPAAPLWFLLLAGGLDLVGRSVPWRRRRPSRGPVVSLWTVALVVLTWVLLVPDFWSSLKFLSSPEVSVADVKRRADYFKSAREKLQLDDPVVFLDPDLGATSYYSGMHVVDTWGLADVPFAVHRYDQAFVADYVFNEVQPDFAHVFGYWNSRVKILQDPRWRRTFLALPPYRNRKGGEDGGNYVNRKHLRAGPAEVPPKRGPMQVFEGGLELVHAKFEPNAVVPGSDIILKLFWRTERKQAREAFFETRVAPVAGDGGPGITLDHQPLHGWYPVSRWRPRVTYKEVFRVEVPRTLPEGRYRLSIRVVDPASGVLRHTVATGDRRSPTTFLNVGVAAGQRMARSLLMRARQLMAAGEAEDAFRLARQARRARGDGAGAVAEMLEASRVAWRDQILSAVRETFPRDPLMAARIFRPAYWRWLDDRVVLQSGKELGDRAVTRARILETRGDMAAAFEAYLAAVWFDPSRAAARRRAEALRLRRLRPGLPPGAPDDVGTVRNVVLGSGGKGKLSSVRRVFEPGEVVMCQVYWRDRLPAHPTRWTWFDPGGVVRFQQDQHTAARTRLSYASIEVPPWSGEWTVEVRWGDRPVAVRRFQVR